MEAESATVMVMDEVTVLQSKVETLSGQMKEIYQWVNNNQFAKAEMTVLRSQLAEQEKSAKDQFSKFNAQMYVLREACHNNQLELDQWVERAMLAEGELREAKERVELLTGNKAELEEALKKKVELMETANTRIAEKEKDIEALNQQMAVMMAKITEYATLTNEFYAREDEMDALSSRVKAKEEEVALLEKEKAEGVAREETLKKDYAEMRKRLNEDREKVQWEILRWCGERERERVARDALKREVEAALQRAEESERKYNERSRVVKEMQAQFNAMLNKYTFDDEEKEVEVKEVVQEASSESEAESDFSDSESDLSEEEVAEAVPEVTKAAPEVPRIILQLPTAKAKEEEDVKVRVVKGPMLTFIGIPGKEIPEAVFAREREAKKNAEEEKKEEVATNTSSA